MGMQLGHENAFTALLLYQKMGRLNIPENSGNRFSE